MKVAGFQKTHCRCRRCDTRKVLPRHPEQYQRAPACPGCGQRDWRPDAWMNKRRLTGCWCGGYWFPHRQGSKYCQNRADGTARYPGDADFADRWGDVLPELGKAA